jgi:hypothetical protein
MPISHLAFAFDSPAARRMSCSASTKCAGVNQPFLLAPASTAVATRAWIVSAAFTDSCWLMIDVHST